MRETSITGHAEAAIVTADGFGIFRLDPASAIHVVLGLLLISGLLLGLLASRFGLPRVAAYVLAGMLFSPSLFGGLLGVRVGAWSEPLTSTALGVIAYLIGGSVTVGQLRRAGGIILGSTLGESLGAVLVVFFAMLLVLPDGLAGVPAITLALAFAAIAAPTAPAATIAVLHQYHARGTLSSTLLGVVALDDAVGIILFAMLAVVTTTVSIAEGLGNALAQILGSVALGLGIGFFLSRLAIRLQQGSLRLPLVVAAVLLSIGLARILDFSPLLSAMTLGFASRFWLGAAGDRLFAPVEYFEELVFLIFFTVAGSLFNPGVLTERLDLVAVYFLARILGKVAGAATGAGLSGAPPVVFRWLGLGLVPQAGVAVGLALALNQHPTFQPVSEIVVNVILGSTFLYELIGPFAVRFALARAGELGAERERGRRP